MTAMTKPAHIFRPPVLALVVMAASSLLSVPDPSRAQEPPPPAPAPAALPAAGPAQPATLPEAPAQTPAATAVPEAASHEATVAPQNAAAGSAEAVSGVTAAELPRNLSPWNMFQSADIVVKAVMIGLAFASIVTWTVWLAKSLELEFAKRKLRRGFRAINATSSLAEAAQRLTQKRGIIAGLIELAMLELRLSSDAPDKAGIKQRVASRLDGLAAAAGRDMNKGTGFLATIGSTAPFVGLFGTVWGIMNSFIGISEAQTTNLAVVAPGIAEALLATAVGLVAAIPAVIIYNQFARAIGAYKAQIAEASAEVQRLVSRDLDRGVKTITAQAAE